MENQFFEKVSEYYSGEEDHERLKKDLESDSGSKELFHWIDLFWNRFKPKTENTENIQKRTYEKISAGQPPESLFGLRAVKYAAAVLLALSVTSVAYYFFRGNVQLIEVASGIGEMKEVELPDGSKMWLNAQSYVRYPEKFKGELREVTMKGEVYFEVEQNKQHPFVVHSDHIQVKVLGTAFLVSDHVNEPVISTYLAKGSIELELKELKKTMKLIPGDEVSFDPKALTYTRINNPHLSVDSWRFGKLSFYNASLFEIARKLERKFGKEIVVDETIGNTKFTADFESETLEQILDFFRVGSQLQYATTESGYIITKK